VIEAGEKQGAAIGQPMNIAVVDAGGNLVVNVRMDGDWIGSIDVSQKKGGHVVGAVGVSGGSGEQDHGVAEATAAAF